MYCKTEKLDSEGRSGKRHGEMWDRRHCDVIIRWKITKLTTHLPYVFILRCAKFGVDIATRSGVIWENVTGAKEVS